GRPISLATVAASPEDLRLSAPRRFLKWLSSHAGGAIVGSVVALGVAWAAGKLGDQPSVPEQLEAEIELAAARGLDVVHNREVDLHGTGAKTRLLVLRPRGKPSIRQSDEVRIYRERDDKLERVFAFR